MARTVDIVAYDPHWVVQYQQEKRMLEEVFGDLIVDIQHFGSTSVEGLSAKPIIDIMIIIRDMDLVDEFNDRMRDHGYEARGEQGIEGRRYFVKYSPDGSGNHTHHIHIYGEGNEHSRNELLFRNYLRIAPQAREEYERMKVAAAQRYRCDPRAYTDAKSECVQKLTQEARAYFGHTWDPEVYHNHKNMEG